jgi:hypothetical protein
MEKEEERKKKKEEIVVLLSTRPDEVNDFYQVT